MYSPQDFLWRSKATDSLNTGWHEFVTDNFVAVRMGMSADGILVTTTNNGVEFSQPYSAPAGAAFIAAYWAIPLGGSEEVYLRGNVLLSGSDVAVGSKTFTVTVYDNDPWPNLDEVLDTIEVTVPAANGVDGMYTSFITTTTLYSSHWSIYYELYGEEGTTGEAIAEIYFVVEDGLTSNSVTVEATD